MFIRIVKKIIDRKKTIIITKKNENLNYKFNDKINILYYIEITTQKVVPMCFGLPQDKNSKCRRHNLSYLWRTECSKLIKISDLLVHLQMLLQEMKK